MENRCKQCGVELKQTMRGRPKECCSDKCRLAYWYRNREARQLRAIKTGICMNCGESFSYHNDEERKCCSRACYIEMRIYGESDEGKDREQVSFEIIAHEETGASNVASDTDISAIAPTPAYRVTLTEEHKIAKPERMWMVCGMTRFNGKIDHFAARIPETFKGQLICGEAFVFCNKKRNQLSILQWQGDGFALYFKRLEYGRYAWPVTTHLKIIEITVEEFRMMIAYTQFVTKCEKWSIQGTQKQDKMLY